MSRRLFGSCSAAGVLAPFMTMAWTARSAHFTHDASTHGDAATRPRTGFDPAEAIEQFRGSARCGCTGQGEGRRPPKLEELVRSKVASGLYTSASEVVREALHLMDEQDRLRVAKLEQLHSDVCQGLAGRAKPGMPKRSRAKREASNIEPFAIRAAVIGCVVKSPRSTWPKLAAAKIVPRRRITSDARAQLGGGGIAPSHRG
jgi:antitoxin ParD1/3/4